MSMRRLPWYVIQTVVGREDHVRKLVLRATDLDERACFVPMIRVGVKREGKWLPAEQPLMPGYLIAETAQPERLAQALRRIDGFARLVQKDDVFAPLSDIDVRWIDSQTQGGSSAVAMSEGYIEAGVLHVTSGPLVGREAHIKKVDHRKKAAYLEIEAFGRTITAQLGIKITRTKECKKQKKIE
ncbi:MAG: antiterminator LoaP [Eggerthellaceae bacterium]|nr:antiterminator LoaP [Eggerthellaceae bacterium]